MPSVREVLEKISELESRKAIQETLLAHLETHYIPSDAGEPDMHITRDDLGLVPEEHISAYLGHLVAEIDQVNKELDGWKGLDIKPPEEGEEKPTPKRNKRKKKRRGTSSQGEDQPDADPSEQGGTGQAA